MEKVTCLNAMSIKSMFQMVDIVLCLKKDNNEE